MDEGTPCEPGKPGRMEPVDRQLEMAQRLAESLTEALEESVALLTADLLEALASTGLELAEMVGDRNLASEAYLKHLREDPEMLEGADAVGEYVERKQRHRLN